MLPARLVVPEDNEAVRLQLNLPAGSAYERFSVGLRGAPGYYELALGGQISPTRAEGAGYYDFQVVRP